MRLLICGSRDWDNYAKVKKVATAFTLGQEVTVIEGCAKGADQMGEKLAEEMGWSIEHYPADWKKYGKSAGPVRNRQMLMSGVDLVLAFHKNNSAGTKHMIDIASAAGVPVQVVK